MATTIDPIKERLTKERDLRVAAQNGVLDTVNRLLESGVNVNAYGEGFRKTALHLAAQENHPEIVQVLIMAGANPLLEDKDNKTALMLATDKRHGAVVKILSNILPTTRQADESKQVSERLALQGYDPCIMPPEKTKTIIAQLISRIETQHALLHTINEEYKAHNASSVIPSIKEKLFKDKTLEQLSLDERCQLENAFSMYKIVYHVVSPAIQHLYELMQHAADKEANSAMVFFTAQSILALCLKHKKQFKVRQNKILKALEALVKQKDPYVNKNTKADTKAILDRISIAFLDHMIDVIQAKFFVIMGKPKGYDEFIAKYFPDIESLELLSYESIQKISGAAKNGNIEEYLAMQAKILNIIERYFEDCETEFDTLLLAKKKDLDTFFMCNTSKENGIQTFHDFSTLMKEIGRTLFSRTLQAMRYHLETFTVSSDLKTSPQWMLQTCYLYGRRLVLVLEEELKDANHTLKEHFQLKCEQLRNTFLRTSNLKEPPLEWTNARAKEKQIQKENEAKKREKSQAQKTAAQLHAFNLTHQKLADAKEQDEKAEIAKKMLIKLANDDTAIALVESILVQGNTQVKIKDFCKLVMLLEIPGADVIKDPEVPPPGNKLTLHHKPHFDAFVTHFPHGKDRVDMIHPETVKTLKTLLETFGITKDNLKKRLATVKKPSVIS